MVVHLDHCKSERSMCKRRAGDPFWSSCVALLDVSSNASRLLCTPPPVVGNMLLKSRQSWSKESCQWPSRWCRKCSSRRHWSAMVGKILQWSLTQKRQNCFQMRPQNWDRFWAPKLLPPLKQDHNSGLPGGPKNRTWHPKFAGLLLQVFRIDLANRPQAPPSHGPTSTPSSNPFVHSSFMRPPTWNLTGIAGFKAAKHFCCTRSHAVGKVLCMNPTPNLLFPKEDASKFQSPCPSHVGFVMHAKKIV